MIGTKIQTTMGEREWMRTVWPFACPSASFPASSLSRSLSRSSSRYRSPDPSPDRCPIPYIGRLARTAVCYTQ